MKEFEYSQIAHGANFTGEGGPIGPTATTLKCLNLDVEGLYGVNEIGPDGRYTESSQVMFFQNRGQHGVTLRLSPDQTIAPGEQKTIKIGKHTVKIEANDTETILFNGQPPATLPTQTRGF